MSERPPDFDRYWDEVDQRLADTPSAPELTHLPLRSNEHCTVYALRITNVGPYRIFGYFSVPNGEGPFPALMFTPGYGSVKAVPDYNDRMRYVTLQVIHRGQRMADEPWAAEFPGLLTHNIDDPERYIYRDIVADCLRGAEFLLARPEVDAGRIAIAGDDLALITAARRPGFSSILAADLILYRAFEACSRTEAYPLEEINEYLRTWPERADAVQTSLAYVDPLHHIERISGTTLLSVSNQEWVQDLLDSFNAPVEQYALTHAGGTDRDSVDAWLAARMGVPAMSRFIREFA